MQFYVILSLDVADRNLRPSIRAFTPRASLLKKLRKTEENRDRQYEYLGEDWLDHSHAKYAGMLSKEEFKMLLADCQLVYEDVTTMGSLTEMGHLPAFAFNIDSIYGNVIGSCYVTPMPEVKAPMADWTEAEIDLLPSEVRDGVIAQIIETNDKNWSRLAKVFKAGSKWY